MSTPARSSMIAYTKVWNVCAHSWGREHAPLSPRQSQSLRRPEALPAAFPFPEDVGGAGRFSGRDYIGGLCRAQSARAPRRRSNGGSLNERGGSKKRSSLWTSVFWLSSFRHQTEEERLHVRQGPGPAGGPYEEESMRATEILMNEHRVIEQMLSVLDEMADRALQRGTLDSKRPKPSTYLAPLRTSAITPRKKTCSSFAWKLSASRTTTVPSR